MKTKTYAMLTRVSIFVILSVIVVGCNSKKKEGHDSSSKELPRVQSSMVATIAFGSCAHEDAPQPVLSEIAAIKPDLFIYLGDNIYGDTYSMDTLKLKYDMLASKPEFQRLKNATTVLATWDDHDFGWNDSGRHYPFKEESKEIFLDFFEEPENSERRNRAGIYTSYFFGETGSKVQVILLDTRTFRDDLVAYNGNRDNDPAYHYGMDFSPNENSDSTLLGEDQWKWLEQELKEPADLRIIASSTQFGITHNGYEAWANIPHEQQKMLDLIKSTQAEGVLFISGDVHYAEISRLEEEGLYPIYDVTSSGITSTWDFATPNDNRVDGPVMENHFGLLTIDWQKEDPEITMSIIDVEGKNRIERKIFLSDLMF